MKKSKCTIITVTVIFVFALVSGAMACTGAGCSTQSDISTSAEVGTLINADRPFGTSTTGGDSWAQGITYGSAQGTDKVKVTADHSATLTGSITDNGATANSLQTAKLKTVYGKTDTLEANIAGGASAIATNTAPGITAASAGNSTYSADVSTTCNRLNVTGNAFTTVGNSITSTANAVTVNASSVSGAKVTATSGLRRR